MKSWFSIFGILCCGMLLICAGAKVEHCFESSCQFTFVITQFRSMAFKDKDTGNVYDVQLRENGTLKLATNRFHVQVPNITVSAEMVHTADGGGARNIILVNSQFPGPTLEVMEGAKISVKVVNGLEREGVSIHWHGIHMDDNVWMDGVPYQTQCPIHPRQSFTYKFIAYPSGTHFYHSHIDLQRLDGLFGGLIVHRKHEDRLIPYFTAVISDWFPITSTEIQILNPYDVSRGPATQHFNHQNVQGFSFDGVEVGIMEFWSGLINGRGRKNDNNAPLAVFVAAKNQTNRMHIVSASGEFAYRVSIDGHSLTVIESDGFSVKPVKNLESVIVFPGERFVVEFETNQSEASGRYWIRATTLRAMQGSTKLEPDGIVWEVKAILQYGNKTNSNQDPISERRNCTVEAHCQVLNCPWPAYRQDFFPNVSCIDVSALKLDKTRQDNTAKLELDEKQEADEEIFLDMAFYIGSSINRRRMVMPSAPLFQRRSTWGLVPCEDDGGGIFCSNIINLPSNKTVQLVLMSNVFSGLHEGSTFGDGGKVHHPMHIHGHSFHVLKTGYPVVDNLTGEILRGNEDIGCDKNTDKTCSKPFWRNGQPSDLNLEDPPLKDTVIVPAMGYTVVRFKTYNPGYWLFHCHTVLHNFEGMALIFNVSYHSHPAVPQDFPTCASFDIDEDERRVRSGENKTETPCDCGDSRDSDKDCVDDISFLETLSTVAASCSSISLFLQILIIAMLFKFLCCTAAPAAKPVTTFSNAAANTPL